MLEMLRRGSQTWLAKGLFLILVAAFGVWGTRSALDYNVNDSVVTVGNQTVSVSKFRMAFQSQLVQTSQQFGRRLTTEEAKMLGVDQAAISRLVAGAALSELASTMKIGVSPNHLRDTVFAEPAFHNATGTYDPNIFEERLRSAGIRAEDYLEDVKDVAINSQITEAASDGFKPPQALIDALTQHERESRAVSYLMLTKANMTPVANPDDAMLAKWFEDNKARYRAPEYRSFAWVKLEPSDIADPAAVTDQQIADDYAKHKDTFTSPETRTLEQLTFPDKAAAEDAAKRLSSGTTFDALVTEQGKTATDVLLGDFTRQSVPTPAMAEAAFAVKTDGGLTGVVDGVVGPVILRVTNIRPEVVKPLDEVKETIRKQIAVSLAADEIQNIYDAFEDSRASGAPLEETAEKLKLKSVVVEAVDADGNDTAGKPVEGLPSDKLVSEIFKTDPGVETSALQVGEAGYVWFETRDITPSRDRTIDEVKDKVLADWKVEAERDAMAKKATEIAGKIKAGAKLEDVAKELGVAVENKSGLTRRTEDAILSPAAVKLAFSGPLGTVAAAPGADAATQIVLVVTEVNPQATGDALDDSEQRVQQLAAAAGENILDQMVGHLQKTYGAVVNTALAERAMVQQ